MRLPEPFAVAGEHLAISLPGAHVVFTTRRGGHSSGPYATLNLGRLTDDDPAVVAANHAALQRQLGVQLASGRQVHGAVVNRITSARAAARRPKADGHATNIEGIAPLVLTADCLPIAIATPGAVAMIHAGWRGLAAGILSEGVRAVGCLAGGGEELVAAIGPAAGSCCYEVGPEVHAVFDEGHHGRNLDLKAIAAAQLGRAGVRTVHDIGLCTICSDPSLFYSHRRDGGITGRQAGIAWLTS